MKLSRIASALMSGSIKGHFGQWGEDVLIRKIFDRKISKGCYLDLGAYHPFTHSNTAYFWMKGWSGINVDANPNTIDLFNKKRPNDQNIWAAVISESEYNEGVREASLLVSDKYDSPAGVAATGTIVHSVAEERGFSKRLKVPTKTISLILEKCQTEKLDYINIDIEGSDELILNELDLKKLAPQVVSIEDYSIGSAELCNSKITQKMNELGFTLAGRAGPTSIFKK
jgi:FkbM family methyltransferase